MEKRTLLAILLIGALSAGYFFYLNKTSSNEQPPQQTTTTQTQQQAQQTTTTQPAQRTAPQPAAIVRPAVVTTPLLANRFSPLGPGVRDMNEAIAYLNNSDKARELQKDKDVIDNKIFELNNKISTQTNSIEKNRLIFELNNLKTRSQYLNNEITRLRGGESFNGVPTQPTEIKFSTELYDGVFTTRGALFKKLIYAKLKGWDPDKKATLPLDALANDPTMANPKIRPFLVSFNQDGASEDELPVYTFDEQESTAQSQGDIIAKVFYVRYFNKGKIFKLVKTFKFHRDKYLIDFSIKIVNEHQGENEIAATNGGTQDGYYLFWGYGLGEFVRPKYRTSYDEEIRFLYYSGADQSMKEVEGKKRITQKIYPTQADWLGLDNRYFFVGFDIKKLNDIAAARGNQDRYNPVQSATISREETDFREQISLSFFKVKFTKKGESRESFIRVYLGPKGNASELLKSGINGLDVVADRGWAIIRPIGTGIKWLLMFLNKYIGNFGISIILLTILIKLLLHPLNKKSMESAKKMQLIQPKIQEVNKQYAKDPQLKQKALMELYKKEGINPLGGSLPLLLQMPFFFALFQTLPVIVDLKNVSFLWIKDLSSPDTIIWGNFFITDQINVLPIIMTLTSLIQSKITMTEGGDSRQQKMMMLLPVVFLFLFYKMPSGLVLYWTIQNVLQILQQIWTNKRLEMKKAAGELNTPKRGSRNTSMDNRKKK